MKSRTRDILRFGLLGVLTFAVDFWLQASWLAIAARLMGRQHIVLDEQPPWIRVVSAAVEYTPWLVGASLLVFAVARRRWVPLLAFAASQVFCIAILVGSILLPPVVRDYASRTPFDSARWKAENRRGAEGTRVHMVDDLLSRHRLEGMPRARVEDLLGKPPESPYFRDYDYVYWLGPERGAFAIDSEWLVIRCKGDVVVSAEVVTD
jgi:hypothetical protein